MRVKISDSYFKQALFLSLLILFIEAHQCILGYDCPSIGSDNFQSAKLDLLTKHKSNPTVYLNLNNQRRPIPNQEIYFRIFRGWHTVRTYQDGYLDRFPMGPGLELNTHLAEAGGKKVYLVEGNRKYIIPNFYYFHQYDPTVFNPSKIRHISQQQMDGYHDAGSM